MAEAESSNASVVLCSFLVLSVFLPTSREFFLPSSNFRLTDRPSSLQELASVMDDNECVESMMTMLDSLDHKYKQTCSISLVPEQLRKSKAEAYRPQVVSIGPLHKGTNTDLLYMEEIKWRCMQHLLQRSKGSEPAAMRKVLLECMNVMLGLDEVVRASYNVDEVRFNRNDLAKIMLVDGCFLLELLICGSPHIDELSAEINKLLPCKLRSPSPGAEVIKSEKVLSDLTLLENQIPFFVLGCLLDELRFKFIVEVDIFQLIHKLALSIMGCDYTTLGSVDIRAFHLVELVHSFVHMEKDAIEKKKNDCKIHIDSEEDVKISHRNERLHRCAGRLEAAGVAIAIQSTPAKSTRFDLKVTFENGKLTIPQLRITETTEAKWRNLIGWERNRAIIDKQRVSQKARTSCQFICYARFFQSLICCVHDVKLLRNKSVIVADGMSDEDLLKFFRNMTKGVSGDDIVWDWWFAAEIKKLNSYPTTRDWAICKIIKYHATRTSKTIWHTLNWFVMWIWYKCRGAYRVLIRDYIPTGWTLIAVLAATAGLLLTAIQTYYTIHPTK